VSDNQWWASLLSSGEPQFEKSLKQDLKRYLILKALERNNFKVLLLDMFISGSVSISKSMSNVCVHDMSMNINNQ
jgi:hypothetical protein